MVVSPSWLPFFLPQPSVLAPTFGGAGCGRRTNTRPKRLNGLFYLPEFIFGRSTGQIRRLGGRKTRQKRIFHQIREFNLLSFRRPCTEFDLT